MAQHDGVISNASGAAVRADLNNALAALITNSSGATSPGTTYAFQFWADTTTGQLKIRNSSNSAWIVLMELDGTMLMEDGTVSAPGLAFASDLNTGFFRSAGDTINVATGGAERLEIGSSEVVFNDPSNDVDFRVESNGNANMLFVDAGNDRVGIGLSSPSFPLTVQADSGTNGIAVLGRSADDISTTLFFENDGTTQIGRLQARQSYFQISGTDNTKGIFIDSTGEVGIGTSSASRTLHVNSGSTNEVARFESSDTEAIVEFKDSTGTASLKCRNDYRFNNSSGELARINSSGQLGIGTSAPDQLLTLASSSDTQLKLTTSNSTAHNRINFANSGSSASGGIWYSSDNAIEFRTNDSEAMRIKSDGNIGIGTTSPQQRQHLHIGSTAACVTQYTNSVTGSGAGDGLLVGLDSTEDGLFWMKESKSLTFGTSNTEKMRLDSSGRLLVGTSSSVAFNGVPSAFQIEGSTNATTRMSIRRTANDSSAGVLVFGKARSSSHAVLSNNDEIGAIEFYGADGTDTNQRAAKIIGAVDGTAGSNDMPGRLMFMVTKDNSATPTERMRIANNGIFTFFNDGVYNFRTAQSASASNAGIDLTHSSTGMFNGTLCFRVTTNGNVANTNNSYGAISDVKLKENIVDATSQWDDLKAIQVRKYNFIEGETHTQIGVIAQEVEAVAPGLVYETPDRDGEGNDLGTVTKGVNYSVLYMKAVKALQEAIDRIETLETKVAALEAS